MKIENGLLLLGILLTACGNPMDPDDLNASSSSSADMAEEASSAASEESSSSERTIPLEQAFDRTFSSSKLGITFRYPSTVYDFGCEVTVPVTVRESDGRVDFIQEWMPGDSCDDRLPDVVFNTMYAARVSGQADVQNFIRHIFSPDCKISETGDYESDGQSFSKVFSEAKTWTGSEMEAPCTEVVTWNRDAGVVYFSHLGSKTGGAINWPSPHGILMPDGSIEYGFDYPIMLSIGFVKAQ